MSRTLTRHATVALHRRDHRRLTPDKNKRRLPVRHIEVRHMRCPLRQRGRERATWGRTTKHPSSRRAVTRNIRASRALTHRAMVRTGSAAASRQLRVALRREGKKRRRERQPEQGQQQDGDELAHFAHSNIGRLKLQVKPKPPPAEEGRDSWIKKAAALPNSAWRRQGSMRGGERWCAL